MRTDGVRLLSYFAQLNPGSIGYIHIDIPRASKTESVKLFAIGQDNEIIEKKFAIDDPDYLAVFSANILLIARLVRKTVKTSGVATVIADWLHYTICRTAFEIAFGENNTLGELVYQTREGGGNDAKYMSIDHETLLIFSRSPSSVGRFKVDKSEDELKKYKETDEHGRYTWDTFIRKQAKTYYPIVCPDDTILEFDEHGQRISWLRSRQRFLTDLNSGEIEFRKKNNEWKLYYKDRLKDSKILRSVSISRDLSEEVLEDFSGLPLKNLLTKHGQQEIRSVKELKPKYLKSTRFYQFLLTAFAKNSEEVLLPFEEYGSAALAVLSVLPETRFITTVSEQFEPLFLERLKGWNDKFIHDINKISFPELVCDLAPSKKMELYTDLIAERAKITHQFTKLESSKDNYSLSAVLEDTVATIIYVGESGDFSPALDELGAVSPEIRDAEELTIFSVCDIPETALDKTYRIYRLPESLL